MFRIGQKVVCVKDGAWKLTAGTEDGSPDPKKHEIVTVIWIGICASGFPALEFKEYFGSHYASKYFRPLSTITIDEVIENIQIDESNLIIINK